MFEKFERAHLGYGRTAGNFRNVTKRPAVREKQYLLPHMTINTSGACSIVNSFFVSQGLNPNNTITVQFDTNLAMLRFKLDRMVDPLGPCTPVTVGGFRLGKAVATQIVSSASQAIDRPSTLKKAIFVICRQDHEGWFYAKVAGYRYETPLPRWYMRLDQSELELWNMPHNVK